jgi:hypothetical protein
MGRREIRGQRIDLKGIYDFNGLNEFAEGERLNDLNHVSKGQRTAGVGLTAWGQIYFPSWPVPP